VAVAITLLQLVQDVAVLLGVDVPSAVVGSNNATAKKLLPYLHSAGPRIRAMYAFPQLTREHEITLVDSQQSYALPDDFDSQNPRTAWDQGNNWMLRGPISGADYQYLEQSLANVKVRKSFRLFKWTDNQIWISPTPSASDAGTIYSLEYQSKTWIRHQTWASGTSYTANAKVWYNGNRYFAVTSGTAGATPPTHTTGTASDGGLQWTYISTQLQERFAQDTDICLLDEELIKLFVQIEYYKDVGQSDTVQLKLADFREHYQRICTNLRGSSTINFLGSDSASLLGDPLLSDGGWTT